MGYVLAWIETLVACLLLVAFTTACSAQLSKRWLRMLLPSLAGLLPALIGLSMAIGGALLMRKARMYGWVFYYTVFWTVAFVVTSVTVLRRGLRGRRDGAVPEDSGRPAAFTWPRAKLAIAAGAAFLLCAMTFWNMDLAARNKLAATRAEAGAIALSLAGLRPPDSQNAALLYEKASELMEEDSGFSRPWAELLQRSSDGDAEIRAFLDKHETALRLLRQGAALPGWYLEYGSAIPEVEVLMSGLGDMGQGARLLALDARVKANQGKARDALADVSAIFGMARHAASGPVLTQALVAMAIGQIGHSALQDVLAHCEPSGGDLEVLAVDEVFSYWLLFRRSMRMEQAYGLSMFATMIDRGAFFLLNEVSGYRSLMMELDRVLALPCHEAREGMKRLETQAREGRWGILQAMLYPALGRAASAAVEAEARHRLDNLALAATAHRIKRGTFPAKPEDLVPEFMMIFPKDPFDGQPMRMATTAEGILFYSVGADMADNGGAEWDDAAKTGDLAFRLRMPSAH
jgi:hypothetical protein